MNGDYQPVERAAVSNNSASDELTRPIVGIENRSAAEVFDIMCDRIKHQARRAANTAVGVRAIEWGETSYGAPEAITIVGVYRINTAWSGGWSVTIKGNLLRTGDGRENFPSVEAAKAAAQADFTARVLSAFDHIPDASNMVSPAIQAGGDASVPLAGWKWELVPDYPTGQVVGHCICGSWPGGECLRCSPTETAKSVAKSQLYTRPASPVSAEVMEAIEALMPIAAIADGYDDAEDDDFQVWKDFDVLGATLPLKYFRRARAALAALSTQGREAE